MSYASRPTIGTWVFVAYLLVSLPLQCMFLGMLARDETPFFVTHMLAKQVDWGGTVFFLLYYAFLYSAYFILPYAAVMNWNSAIEDRGTVQGGAAIIGGWGLLTMMLFHRPITGFLGSLMQLELGGTFHQWMIMLWLAWSVVVVSALAVLGRGRRKAKGEQ